MQGCLLSCLHETFMNARQCCLMATFVKPHLAEDDARLAKGKHIGSACGRKTILDIKLATWPHICPFITSIWRWFNRHFHHPLKYAMQKRDFIYSVIVLKSIQIEKINYR